MSVNDDDSNTNVSLLMRIRADERDEVAWREFVDLYGYRIYGWCLNRKLQTSDAEDITQEVLVKLAKKLGSLDYDANQSFRAWLRRVTENTLIDFFRERRLASGGSAIFSQLGQKESREDLAKRLEEAFDLELMEEAIRRVRSRVSEERFHVWQRMSRESASGGEVAEELNMKIATVYTARGQVQDLIRKEIQDLEKSGFGGGSTF